MVEVSRESVFDAHGRLALTISNRTSRSAGRHTAEACWARPWQPASAPSGTTWPVIVDLAALRFCDASGLGALLRMADHAERTGRPFRLASPSPSLTKIMRIASLDHRLQA